mgnify:CR=1 FL=1
MRVKLDCNMCFNEAVKAEENGDLNGMEMWLDRADTGYTEIPDRPARLIVTEYREEDDDYEGDFDYAVSHQGALEDRCLI